LTLASCAALLTLTTPAAAAKPKLDRALNDAVDSGVTGQLSVIITAAPGSREKVRAKLVAHEKAIKLEHPAINAISATIDASDLADLIADPAVASVSIDSPVQAHETALTGRDSIVTLDMLRPMLGTTATGVTGRGVGVAIIDSGIGNIPDVYNRLGPFYDFVAKGGKQVAACDDFGHGTHIAATIASSGQQNGYTWTGIATGVKLIGLKVLDKNGNGTTSDVISALQFTAANKAALGIDVINLSLGHPVYESAATDPLVQAVEQAVHAGIVVVTSAGNYGLSAATGLPGYGGITSPGNAPSAITVGASNTSGTLNRSDDFVAPYSSRGPTWIDGFAKPDVVAPGHRIAADTNKTYLYTKYPSWNIKPAAGSGQYVRLSGSSMAAGVATGVVALVLEANRTTLHADLTNQAPLNPYAVKAILQYTATTLADSDALSQGAGEINADGAVALTRALDTRTTPWSAAPLA
jgi:serine protease AprX